MAEEEQKEHKRLDAEQLIGLELSTDEFIKIICSSITVIDIDEMKQEETKCNLPYEIGTIIVSFLRIQQRQAVKVGDELWVRMDSKKFRATVGYMQASYPWASKGRKLMKDADAYLEGLELWERYRVKYDLINDFGYVLSNQKLKELKLIMKALPNRAAKHASADLITTYGTYNLFSSFGVATRDIIGNGPMKRNEFVKNWEIYGDDVENLSTNLTTEQINEWRASVDKICHFKQELYAEIINALFGENYLAKVRKIHLSTDMFRDRTKYIYDIYIGQQAVLFQRVHSD